MVAEVAAARAIRLDDVAQVVTRFYSVSVNDLRGPSRATRYVRPRQAFMYLARWVGAASLQSIADYLGRDHSTVYHGSSKLDAERRRKKALDVELSKMSAALYEISGYRPPEFRDETPEIKFFDGCQIAVSRYVFGLTDLMVALASNNVPKRAWVERTEIEGGSLKFTLRWQREEVIEVAS